MAAYTQIIDLFGIPACGKTTLSNCLAGRSVEALRISTLQDCILNDKKIVWRLLRSLSLNILWAGIRFRFSAPFDKKRRDVSLMSFMKHGLYYNYVRRFSDYDIVIVDHGDIQSIVTLERGEDLHNKTKFVKACSRYLNSSLADIYIYCRISAEEALSRMHNRQRDNGRIDVIGNKHQQLKELNDEISRFEFFAEFLKNQKKNIWELDMNNKSSVIADSLINRLVNK